MAEEQKSHPPSKSNSEEIDPRQLQLFQDWLENERQNMEIRKEELTLRDKNLERAHAYNMAALEAQREFLRAESSQKPLSQRNRFFFIGVLVLMVLVFLGFLAMWNKDQVAKDFIMVITLILGGGGSGAGYVAYRYSKRENTADTTDDPEAST